MLQAFGQVIVLMALLGGVLLGLYTLTRFLPGAWRERAQVVLFAGPAVFLVFAGLFVPAVRTLVTSFKSDNAKEWVGLDNYREIFSGTATKLVLTNTFTWVIGGTALVIIGGLVIARYADGMPGEKVWKSMIFIPAAISLVGAGLIWKFIYAGPPFEVGLANEVTGAIPGLPASLGGDGDKIWLVDRNIAAVDPPGWGPGLNTFLLVVIFIWVSTGLATVFFSAAMKGVPDSLIDAARVDGATKRQTFFQVVLPYISATVVAVTTITAIGALKVFDIVAATTAATSGRARSPTSSTASTSSRVATASDRRTPCSCCCS